MFSNTLKLLGWIDKKEAAYVQILDNIMGILQGSLLFHEWIISLTQVSLSQHFILYVWYRYTYLPTLDLMDASFTDNIQASFTCSKISD